MVQPCIWFKEEQSQFSMVQTAQSLTCSIMEKPHTKLGECPRILLSYFRARNSVSIIKRTTFNSFNAHYIQAPSIHFKMPLSTPHVAEREREGEGHVRSLQPRPECVLLVNSIQALFRKMGSYSFSPKTLIFLI